MKKALSYVAVSCGLSVSPRFENRATSLAARPHSAVTIKSLLMHLLTGRNIGNTRVGASYDTGTATQLGVFS